MQVEGKAVGRDQSVRVIIAMDAATARQGVFIQFPGRLVSARRPERDGETVRGPESIRVILAKPVAPSLVQVAEQTEAGAGIAAPQQVPGRAARQVA
jgi:hypothetical protein